MFHCDSCYPTTYFPYINSNAVITFEPLVQKLLKGTQTEKQKVKLFTNI
jgi:hypothetical protein